MQELIDLYEPDLLYSDGALPFGTNNESIPGASEFECGLTAVSYLYNKSVGKHGENRAVYTQKDRRREVILPRKDGHRQATSLVECCSNAAGVA